MSSAGSAPAQEAVPGCTWSGCCLPRPQLWVLSPPLGCQWPLAALAFSLCHSSLTRRTETTCWEMRFWAAVGVRWLHTCEVPRGCRASIGELNPCWLGIGSFGARMPTFFLKWGRSEAEKNDQTGFRKRRERRDLAGSGMTDSLEAGVHHTPRACPAVPRWKPCRDGLAPPYTGMKFSHNTLSIPPENFMLNETSQSKGKNIV